VFDELASGGMASVYLACRLGAGESARVVAVKKMFESFAKRPELVTMFLDEAHIAARIRHPNVVTTWEFLRVPGSLAIVMEFVLGVSLVDLQEIMTDRGFTCPIRVTAAIVCNTLEGLHAAHETQDEHGHGFGLVHRDVSPHNILIGKDGVARVIDFGIAKAAGRLQVTDVGVMKGKMAYMAPEQIRVDAVDRRVDVYSTGVLLWEALTGRGLFQGPGELEQFALRGAGTVKVEPPSSVNPLLSSKLDAVVLRALQVNPKKRFENAHDMAVALADAVDPATQAEVASWVNGLAGSKIRELEEKRNEVEASYASGELAGLSGVEGVPVSAPASSAPPVSAPSRVSAPPGSAPPPVSGTPPPPASFDVPDLVPQPRPSKPVVAAPRDTPPPPSRRTSIVSAPSFDEGFEDSGPSDLRLDVEMPAARSRMSSPSLDGRNSSLPPEGRLSSPSLDPQSRAVRSRRPPTRRSGPGRGAFVVLALVAVLGVAALRFGPDFLKSSVVTGAARRGLVVEVDHIEPRAGGVALEGARITLAGVDGVALNAPEIEIGLDWQGNVQRVFVAGYELSLRGSAGEIATRIAAWRREPHVPIVCEGKSGHLLWTDAVVPGAPIEGLDASLTVTGDSDDRMHLEVPSVTVNFPGDSFGPWRAVLDATSGETKLAIALDRSKTDGPPSVSVVARPNLGTVLSATIPRTKASQIGIPPALVNGNADGELGLLVEGQLPPTGDRVTAHATLTVFEMPNATPGGPPADVVMEGTIGGVPSQVMHVESGSLLIAKVKNPLLGEVTLGHDGLRVEIDRPSAKGPPPPPFVLDTRDWMQPAGTLPAASTRPAVTSAPAPSAGRHRRP
jgi:serine/threonine protein kinase